MSKNTTNYCWVSEKGRVAIGTIKYVGLGLQLGSNWQYSEVITLMLPFIAVEVRMGGLKY